MKPMPDVEPLLERAVKRGVFGTKMRSFINLASQEGIAAVVKQQFDIADQIVKHGLMPIIEPRGLDQEPGQGGCRGHPSCGDHEEARRPAGGAQGDAQIDDSEHAGPLCAVHRA